MDKQIVVYFENINRIPLSDRRNDSLPTWINLTLAWDVGYEDGKRDYEETRGKFYG